MNCAIRTAPLYYGTEMEEFSEFYFVLVNLLILNFLKIYGKCKINRSDLKSLEGIEIWNGFSEKCSSSGNSETFLELLYGLRNGGKGSIRLTSV